MFGQGENQGLEVIRVGRGKLMRAIIDNKNAHVKEYAEAMSGYRKKAVEDLEAALNNARSGGKIENLSFAKPSSHEKDYQDVIDLLEMSEDETLEITFEQFKRYVKDDWDWTRSFKSLHTTYSAFNEK